MSWDLNEWMCGGKTVFHEKDQHNTQVMQSLGEKLFLLGFRPGVNMDLSFSALAVLAFIAAVKAFKQSLVTCLEMPQNRHMLLSRWC